MSSNNNTKPKESALKDAEVLSIPSTKAAARLNALTDHLSQPGVTGPRSRRKKSANSKLPADYSDVLGQLNTLKKMAATPDTSLRGYVRQKQAGKLWVRERVDQLFDVGTLHEVGSVTGTTEWKRTSPGTEEPEKHTPSNSISGTYICSCFRLR